MWCFVFFFQNIYGIVLFQSWMDVLTNGGWGWLLIVEMFIHPIILHLVTKQFKYFIKILFTQIGKILAWCYVIPMNLLNKWTDWINTWSLNHQPQLGLKLWYSQVNKEGIGGVTNYKMWYWKGKWMSHVLGEIGLHAMPMKLKYIFDFTTVQVFCCILLVFSAIIKRT